MLFRSYVLHIGHDVPVCGSRVSYTTAVQGFIFLAFIASHIFLIPVDIMWRNKVGVLIILISIRIEEVGFGREDRQWCILYVCLLLFHYSVPRPYLAR